MARPMLKQSNDFYNELGKFTLEHLTAGGAMCAEYQENDSGYIKAYHFSDGCTFYENGQIVDTKTGPDLLMITWWSSLNEVKKYFLDPM